jgi:hypothetical protein
MKPNPPRRRYVSNPVPREELIMTAIDGRHITDLLAEGRMVEAVKYLGRQEGMSVEEAVAWLRENFPDEVGENAQYALNSFLAALAEKARAVIEKHGQHGRESYIAGLLKAATSISDDPEAWPELISVAAEDGVDREQIVEGYRRLARSMMQ